MTNYFIRTFWFENKLNCFCQFVVPYKNVLHTFSKTREQIKQIKYMFYAPNMPKW